MVKRDVVLRGLMLTVVILYMSLSPIRLLANSVQSDKLQPVVIIQRDFGGFLIGGLFEGRWLSDEAISGKISGDEHYKVYSDKKYLGDAEGSVTKEEPPFRYWIDLSSLGKDSSIAIAGDWNPIPRVAKNLNTQHSIYLACIRRVLDQHGLHGSAANATSIWRVDLEGDRQAEVIISATSKDFNLNTYEQGDFSFVLLRKIIKGKVKEFVLEGEFHTQKERKEYYPSFCHADMLVDVDGDGILEVCVVWNCPSGDGVGFQVFKLKEQSPVMIYNEWFVF